MRLRSADDRVMLRALATMSLLFKRTNMADSAKAWSSLQAFDLDIPETGI
jgi:hypothetical protein